MVDKHGAPRLCCRACTSSGLVVTLWLPAGKCGAGRSCWGSQGGHVEVFYILGGGWGFFGAF